MAKAAALLNLSDEQKEASAGEADVWVTASAGTGKTQVLSSRVLRLLLNGAKAESLLCLTFTKSGAAEMAERVNARLAYWVRAKDAAIRHDLNHLGEPVDAERIARARTLFAEVLDARGGGLRIQTIHAFCQTLLTGFPAEADLTPGFRPLEDRDVAEIEQRALTKLLAQAEAQGDHAFKAAFGALALKLDGAHLLAYLRDCARAKHAMLELGSGTLQRLRRFMGLPTKGIDEDIRALSDLPAWVADPLMAMQRALSASGGVKNAGYADRITHWLALPSAARADVDALTTLSGAWSTGKGDTRKASAALVKLEPDFVRMQADVCAYFAEKIARISADRTATALAQALLVGQRFVQMFEHEKRAVGGVDFDDLIQLTARLLRTEGMGDWIRFKLDQTIDHILVDEAQDTNEAQWQIIRALAEEFYAGAGQKSGHRTVFVVGDIKQAIFGFQGTDPRSMLSARAWFEAKIAAADRHLHRLSLGTSYRSAPYILSFVDALTRHVGAEQMGIGEAAEPHVASAAFAGGVWLLPPVSGTALSGTEASDDVSTDDEDGESGDAPEEEKADTPADRQLATEIAAKIRSWLDGGLGIENRRDGKIRPLRPGDIMILLRSRSTLAQLLVARLIEANIPVAGVDRMRINAPLPVRDILAAVRFVLQPDDDLNTATLLVSPLIGWSQEMLQQLALARGSRTLWTYLSQSDLPARIPLRDMLGDADGATPGQFVETLLSGTLQGRAKLLARFGEEARDPLAELLSAALSYEVRHVPTLQGFLHWIERDENDLKRETARDSDAVRIMTAHASKGLQAPLVILADATRNGRRNRLDRIELDLGGLCVPVPAPNQAMRHGPLDTTFTAQLDADAREHWRLLYVAATRAEQQLVIAGALPKRGVPDASWYTKTAEVLQTLGATTDASGALFYGIAPRPASAGVAVTAPQPAILLPDWCTKPAPAEARPPRPLAPSALTTDTLAEPPPSDVLRAAAERGRLLHALFERLPAVAPDQRADAADRWLAGSAGIADDTTRHALIADALAVINAPAYAAIFGPAAMAEVPLAGVVAGVVIAGTVDRLVVTDTHVTVVDFKTMRRPPTRIGAIPLAHLRQMAAYQAVLADIFPDRIMDAALLYTAAPALFRLSAADLAAHKPSLALEQAILTASGLSSDVSAPTSSLTSD